MNSSDDEDKSAAEMFGEPVPGEAVTVKYFDPCAGYHQRPGFHRGTDGRAFPNVDPRETPETELPDDYYSRD